ncbi:MAG: hypothetical protein U0W40_05575 [Acidimicrobiia bacterium]
MPVVVIDFDGEAAQADEVAFMVERLGPPEWCELHAGSSVQEAWESIAADEATIRAVAAEVPVDPAFRSRVEALREEGADVIVVSHGFGLVVELACAGLDVEVRSNHVDFTTGRLEVRA